MNNAPLADRLRPSSLDDMVGQTHLLGKGKALRNIIESGSIPNLIFYGSAGIGKTTLARIIAKTTNRRLYKLNGTTASTKDLKEVFEEVDTLSAPKGILLYLDEIQYFNKKQQQTLLEYIENGKVTLIASTTENPHFYVYNAILSRSSVFEFLPVEAEEVARAVHKAFDFLRSERNEEIAVDDGVEAYIAYACGGDVRKSINAVELCVLSTPVEEDGSRGITLERAKELTQRSSVRYDREGDEHYDILSAFQKSMRGSDPDAAIHYLARLLEAGDMQSACRRLIVCACEDVGLAFPNIIPIVKACVDTAFMVGLPEAQIPLADAVILVATSPKSNSGVNAIAAARADIQQGRLGAIPADLRDSHYQGAKQLGRGKAYKYPHDYQGGWVKQQYLPEELLGAGYYQYGENRTEQAARAYWERIKLKVES
ncbi:MAG: replication-associated recombination protein A [Oscillospiraceae bacterium]|jgi:putative ATPase|nr:replication-associated recombination protein A [Oscillospiraceae bacterium]